MVGQPADATVLLPEVRIADLIIALVGGSPGRGLNKPMLQVTPFWAT